MSDTTAIPPGSPGAVSRFYDNYLKCLIKASIPEKQRRWYVQRVEEFIRARDGHRIKDLSAAEIHRYFEMPGREKRLAGWQFRQCIDAIRILYCELLASPPARDIDWSYWFASARELEASHPTMAPLLSPGELGYLKERKAEGPMNRVRHAYHELLVRFAGEIRRRGYSYRTEQSYEQWICRFILFCGDTDPEGSGPAEVKSFLNHLSIQRSEVPALCWCTRTACVRVRRSPQSLPRSCSPGLRQSRHDRLPAAGC